MRPWFEFYSVTGAVAATISVLVLLFSPTVVSWEVLVRIAKTTLNKHQV
jgi:hypothetical protein